MLIFDGHNSHLTYNTVKSAIDNNVILLCLPPHTSHALQPLDVSVFRSVKTMWKQILMDYLRESRIHSIDKSVFPKLLSRLWPRLVGEHAVNGFEACGLFPLNRTAVNHKVIKQGRIESSGSSDDNPTPRKALKKAILQMVSPTEPIKKRGPRKRVQHVTGEVLTEAIVLERLRQEEIDRQAKKKSRPTLKVKKPVGRPKKAKNAKKALSFISDISDCDSEEQEVVDPKMKDKVSRDRWSSEGASDSDNNIVSMMEEIVESLDSDKDVERVDSPPPVPGTSNTRKKERWEIRSYSPPPLPVASDIESDEGVHGHESDEEPGIQEMSSYVIVNYEGSHFPGLVTKVKKSKTVVSCMIKSGLEFWKWPEIPDVCDYSPDEIVEVISTPTLTNNRGLFRVPEADKYWK